jgi:ribonucleotide monophosphatase NagD (HAD superfamily)
MQEFNLNETMMIGDRLDTDVKFGNCSGMKCSALVLTGFTTVNDVEDMIDKAVASGSNLEENFLRLSHFLTCTARKDHYLFPGKFITYATNEKGRLLKYQ